MGYGDNMGRISQIQRDPAESASMAVSRQYSLAELRIAQLAANGCYCYPTRLIRHGKLCRIDFRFLCHSFKNSEILSRLSEIVQSFEVTHVLSEEVRAKCNSNFLVAFVRRRKTGLCC